MYQNTDVKAVASNMERRKWGNLLPRKRGLTFCLQEVEDINYPEVGLVNSILNAFHLKHVHTHTPEK